MWCYGMNNKINSYVLKCISNDTCLQARMTFTFALNYLADVFYPERLFDRIYCVDLLLWRSFKCHLII